MTMVEPLSALLMTMSVLLARFYIGSLSFLVRLVSLRSINSVFIFSMSIVLCYAWVALGF